METQTLSHLIDFLPFFGSTSFGTDLQTGLEIINMNKLSILTDLQFFQFPSVSDYNTPK